MPEAEKRKILIASVLKPVDDTRITEKIGESLKEINKFEVHIIGFQASIHPQGLHYYPLPFFKRLSLTRLFIPWKIFRMAMQIKPHLFIITTHELLCISVFIKLITGCKIIYDVQENYYRNIFHTSAFPGFVKPVIAFYVKLKEHVTASLMDHFFLAEKAYAEELSFQGKRFIVLENKLKISGEYDTRKRDYNHLVFSGTLAETTGLFKAIDIAVKLHDLDPNIWLSIIGYCPQPEVLKRLRTTIAPHSFIQLIGGDKHVPHRQIAALLQHAGAGIISYPLNPSTSGAMPTKLYEYLGYQLPIILIDHEPWVTLCRRYQAAVVFDPQNVDAEAVLTALRTKNFYTVVPTDVYWESEKPKLILAVTRLLS